MSTRFILSAYVGGGALLLFFVAAAFERFVPSRRRRVTKFASRLGLAVSPAFHDRLADRLRRRAVTRQLALAPLAAVYIFWVIYRGGYILFLGMPADYQPSGISFPLGNITFWTVGGLAVAAAHVYDVSRSFRHADVRVARLVEPQLSDAVPVALIWLVRTFALLPAAAACVWIAAPVSVQHGSAGVHPHPVLMVAMMVLAPVSVAATERVQRWILSGPQHAVTPQELAFDDALKVDAVLAMLVVPVGICVVAAAILVTPLTRAVGWPGAMAVAAACIGSSFPVMALMLIPQSPRACRYFLKRFARFSADGPGQVPPPTATMAAQC